MFNLKSSKIKNLFKFLPVALFGFCLVLSFCSKNDETDLTNGNSAKSAEIEDITETWPFTLEVDGQTINGELTLDWNHETETANEILVSGNVLSDLDLSQEDFNSKLGDATEGEGYGHAGCIAGCNDKYTDENGNKIRGRGACKANCWVETAVRILEAVAKIAAAVSK